MAAIASTDRPTKFRMSDDGEGWHRGLVYSGHVLDFDGTDDYIDVGDTGGQCRTIMFLMKADNLNKSIIDLDGGTHTVTISSGQILANGFTSATIYIDGVSTSGKSIVLTTLDWYHVAITTDTAFDVDDLDIGRVASAYFDGMLSNVIILNKALTQSNIYSSFWHPENPLPPGISVDDIVGWWPLNENNASVTHAVGRGYSDMVGVISGATIVNGIGRPVPQTLISGYNDYYWLDGTGDYVIFSGITSDFDITGYFEMTVKFYMPLAQNQTIFSSSVSASNMFGIQDWFGNFTVGCYDGSSYTTKSTTSFIRGKFYTLTLTVDNKAVTAYLDGVEMTSSNNMALNSTASTAIGSYPSGAGHYYNGIVVSVEQTGKHLWYNKNGFVDEIGSADGTVNGSAIQFRMTNGLNLDYDPYKLLLNNVRGLGYYIGNEYIQTWDKDNLDILSTISLAAWIKFENTGSQETIIGKEDTYELAKSSAEKVIISIYQTTNKFTLSTSTLSVDTWYYVVGTYDGGAGSMKIYINGVLDKTDTTYSGNIDTTANYVTTGKLNGSSTPFTGIIDEAKIYSDILTASEVITNYRAGLTEHS